MRSGGEADPVKTNKDPFPYPSGEGEEVVFFGTQKTPNINQQIQPKKFLIKRITLIGFIKVMLITEFVLLTVSSTTFNKIQQIQQNKILGYTIMDDPKFHAYWHALGCPTDDEDIKEEFYNPVVLTKWHTMITIALPKLPEERDVKREIILETIQRCREVHQYRYMSDKTILFSLEFYSLEKKLKVLKDNFHVHMLVKGKYAKLDRKRIIRDLSKKFKVEANFVDVKYHSSPELFSTREEYIKGSKQESKDIAIQKDKEERKAFEIQDFYFLSV